MRRTLGNTGFSIGELVLVMGLASALTAAVVPVAGRILASHRLSAAAREVGFEITRARMQAVGQNVFVRIALDTTNGYARERSTDGVTWERDGQMKPLPSGVTLRAGASGTPRFDRQGIAAASTALTLSSAAGQKTVSTSIVGRVTTR